METVRGDSPVPCRTPCAPSRSALLRKHTMPPLMRPTFSHMHHAREVAMARRHACHRLGIKIGIANPFATLWPSKTLRQPLLMDAT
jgi:hypothetical protein